MDPFYISCSSVVLCSVGRLSGRRESPSSAKNRGSASSASSARADRLNSFSAPSSAGQKQAGGSATLSPSPVWSANEPRRSSSSATTGAGAAAPADSNTGHSRPAGQWVASHDEMNRRRSDGYGLGGGASRYSGGNENAHPSQYYHPQQNRSPHYPSHQQQQLYQQQQQPKKQSNLQLLSMKSSPNLAHCDQDERREFEPGGTRPAQQPSSSRLHMSTARSSPNIQADINSSDPQNLYQKYSSQQHHGQGQKSPEYINIANSTPDLFTRGSGRHDTSIVYTSGDLTPTSSSSSQVPLSASHGLHRYQADYENLSHLSAQPLRSEKISEISDIDEITGQDSLPTSPELERNFVKESYLSDKNRGNIVGSGQGGSAPVGGPPTRDPMALKNIKVNQSHEKYPSWPVTQSSIGSSSGDQAASINSRAQSMTDHTNTSSEFPKKQRLAYTPGLRPLAERNSPTGGADDHGKSARNASDPGFKKTDFVYDQIGRVQKRGHDAVDQRFDDFYKNSQPGYPPPAMDSDGHIIGDKEYSAPSPPERDAKGVSERELSQHLTGYIRRGDSSSPSSHLQSGQSPGRELGSKPAVPARLNIVSSESGSPRQGVSMVDSGNSPMEVASPLASPNRPLSGEFVSRPLTHFQSEKYRSSQGMYRESSMQPNIQRNRPNSYTATHTDREAGLSSKGVIVRSTPYYNTSTQTDMMPYAIKISDPLVVASKLRNAQVQASEFSSQTSPKSPQQQQFEEKSIQARLSRDIQDPLTQAEGQDNTQQGNKTGSSGRFFNYPPMNSVPNTNYLLLNQQSSPFPGIKSIQAKYATDEGIHDSEDFTNVNNTNRVSSTSIDDHGSIRSAFSDNSASILRKLSQEFYANRLGGDKQQRISSNSTATHSSSSSMSTVPEHQPHSPRLDLATTISQQPGLREAESYSSVVIHHDQSPGLFGRDDYCGSVLSVAGDSMKHDSSNYSDVSIGGGSNSGKQQQVLRDAVGTSRSRRSLDPSYFSQKNRLQGQDPRVSSSMASLSGQQNKQYHHHRDLSAPVSSTSSLSLSQNAPNIPLTTTALPGLNKRRPHDLSIISDSSVVSNPKSSSSEARSSNSTSFGSNTASPSATQTGLQTTAEEGQGSVPTNMRPFSTSSVSNQDNELLKRLSSRRGSDSVFIGDDDPSDDYQFNRKPSMRKAYGIYDETEGLISMSAKPQDKAKPASSNGSSGAGSSSEPSGSAPPISTRTQRFADGLDLIQEEGVEDNKIGKTSSSAGVGRKDEWPQKYAWQNEAWLRSRLDIPKGSNLKRTASEQIYAARGENQESNTGLTSMLRSSLDSKPNTYRNSSKNSDYGNSRLFAGRFGSQHNRTQSEDRTKAGGEAELKQFQQQAVLSFCQRKMTASTPSPVDQGRKFPGKMGTSSSGSGVPLISSLSYSPDSSLYEPIGGKSNDGISPTESVDEIIHKAHENIAKSAQRVDSIRRSNSTTKSHPGSGHGLSGEYMDMVARNRRETEWSRMRSSGSLRYSPDSSSTDPRRSNRSSFASENHYEDISMFANSTPRGSVSESVPDSGFSG
ncbi:hypothetical protein ElyMa_003231100 [Elysia marginata]|uniref:Uncharacterized protein n=1 Tax=Elysia marginata TaxID=1093978 RepID=A0AAV4J2W1_9GAST|nr:hypothetical protein ElyMa_003231100 [Elysia marginata]